MGNGHDDATLKELQAFFKPRMVKVDRDYTKAPDWLDISRTVVPDFLIKDPKKHPLFLFDFLFSFISIFYIFRYFYYYLY